MPLSHLHPYSYLDIVALLFLKHLYDIVIEVLKVAYAGNKIAFNAFMGSLNWVINSLAVVVIVINKILYPLLLEGHIFG